MKDKLVALETKTNQSRAKLLEGLRNFKENFEVILEQYTLNAKLKRHFYTKLVEQGFTKIEALELIKGM